MITSKKIACMLILPISLLSSNLAQAATSPNIWTAGNFWVLSSTYTNTAAGTNIAWDIWYTTGPAVLPTTSGTFHIADTAYSAAGIAQGSALSALNSQGCTFNFESWAVDLSTDTTHGPIGVYTPWVYCIDGAASVWTAGITFNGAGTYIFRMSGALTTVANSQMTLSGASACDIWWTPGAATTLGANSSFEWTNIDDYGITVGNAVNWNGRALAFGWTVTTILADSIIAPTCLVPSATLTVTKTVINDNGGTKVVSDFPLSVGMWSVTSWVANTLPPGNYTLSESNTSGYTATSWSGDCSSTWNIILLNGDNKTCTITNNDTTPGVLPLPVDNVIIPPVVPVISDVPKLPNTWSGSNNTFWFFAMLLFGMFVSLMWFKLIKWKNI